MDSWSERNEEMLADLKEDPTLNDDEGFVLDNVDYGSMPLASDGLKDDKNFVLSALEAKSSTRVPPILQDVSTRLSKDKQIVLKAIRSEKMIYSLLNRTIYW